MNTASIGIFDSGIGGLTVFSRIAARMPDENMVYLGDTARLPYGTKSADTVVRYARACAHILLQRGIKALVVACNTASAHAMDSLHGHLPVPVIGVVEPGARTAVARTRNQRIGVIGTAGTIASGAYPAAIHALLPEAQVFATACPLFVPLAEEGWTEGEVPRAVAQRYLAPLLDNDIDTLVLGCTHYPLLAPMIQAVMGPEITLVDSAEETARALEALLDSQQLRGPGGAIGTHTFLASDAPDSLARVGARFLGQPLDGVEWVDF